MPLKFEAEVAKMPPRQQKPQNPNTPPPSQTPNKQNQTTNQEKPHKSKTQQTTKNDGTRLPDHL